MKSLNLVLTSNSVSDIETGDPIKETKYPNIRIYSENKIPNEFFLYFIKLGNKHCNNLCGGAFDTQKGIFYSTPQNIKDRIKNNTAKILISWPMESFLQDNILNDMHRYFEGIGINPESVIYLSCCPNADELYRDYCQRNNVNQKLIMAYIPWYLYGSKNHVSEPYRPGYKSKKFLCLNRRMHRQRIFLLMRVYKENLLNDFFYSFPSQHPASKESFIEKTKPQLPFMQQFLIDQTDIEAVAAKLPMKLDISNWEPYPLPIRTNELDYFYSNSLFSLVTETYFYSKIIHLTEKTFKPIINRHPFIMISAPGTLKKIKEFGFKSFDCVIDESYDNIADDNERFEAVLKLIKEICSWNEDKSIEVSRKIQEIVDFNYQHLKSRSSIELNKFIDQFGV